MKIPKKLVTILSFLYLYLTSSLLFCQDNIYHPKDIDSLFDYLEESTDFQIKKLDKKYYRKKKKLFLNRVKTVKNQVEDSTYVFVPELTSHLNRVLNVIYDANPELKKHSFYFLFDNSTVPNASAFGDGTFVVNLGLFEFLESDDELAFVLCHEIAHFINKDFNAQVEKYITQINSDETKSRVKLIKRKRYGQTTAGLNLIKELSFDMFDYSREKEMSADKLGLEIFLNTSYNPNAPISALKKLGELEELIFKDSVNLDVHFGFKEYPFKKQWLKKQRSLFDISDAIDDYEFNKDSLRTHPYVKDRIHELLVNNQIDTITTIRENKALLNLKDVSYEFIVKSLLDHEKYDLLLYTLLRNIQNGQMTMNDYDNLAKTLKQIHHSKKKHSLGRQIPQTSPFSEEVNLNQIRLFLHNTELRDIKKIGHYFCVANKEKMTEETYNEIYKYFKL